MWWPWRRRTQPKPVKTKELHGILIKDIRLHISAALEISNGFMCKPCGQLFTTLEDACLHLRVMSDVKPHPYIAIPDRP